MANAFGTDGDDIMVPVNPGDNYLGRDGNDIYFIDQTAFGPGTDPIVINDVLGENRIRFAAGTEIVSSTVIGRSDGTSAIELVIGASPAPLPDSPAGPGPRADQVNQTVQILGDATTLTFDIGATSLTQGFSSQNFDEFVTDTLGTTIPDPGQSSQGGPAMVEPITLSISASDVDEGDVPADNTRMILTVTSNRPAPEDIDFELILVGGGASSPDDFNSPAVIVGTIAEGTNTATILVDIVEDTVIEPDELIIASLLSVSDGAIGGGFALGTIRNDDFPTISINDVSVQEPAAGTVQTELVPLTLSSAAPFPISVEVGIADGTALAGEDFDPPSNGVIEIPPLTTQMDVPVDIIGDSVAELEEVAQISLFNPQNAGIQTGTALLTIIADALPRVEIEAVSPVGEGDGEIAFRLKLVDQTGAPVTSTSDVRVDVVTGGGTGSGEATPLSDYSPLFGQPVTIPAGQSEATVTVQVLDDDVPEIEPSLPDPRLETFNVLIENPVNAVLGQPTAVGEIIDDDPLPVPTSNLQLAQRNLASPLGGPNDVLNSAIGELLIDLPPVPGEDYLNVIIGGNWVIQNLSLPQPPVPGSPMFFGLNPQLPNIPGDPLFEAPVIAGTSPLPIDFLNPPIPPQTIPVDGQNFLIGGEVPPGGDTIDLSNILEPLPFDPLPLVTPEALQGERVVKSATLPDLDQFVNQEQGLNQCCNTAVSNSLKYLQATGKAPPTLATSPNDIGTLLGTDNTGTPINWHQTKATIPGIQVERIEAQDADKLSTADIDALIAAVNAGKDVEIDLDGHVAVVVGVRVKANGKIELDLFDDNQLMPGADPMRVTAVSDDGGVLKVDGAALERFVIESFPGFPPPAPPQLLARQSAGEPADFDPDTGFWIPAPDLDVVELFA